MRFKLLLAVGVVILLAAGVIIWDNFFRIQPTAPAAECMAVCLAADSYVSGWYNSCSGELIRYGECSGKTPLPLSDPSLISEQKEVSGSPATEYCKSQGGTVGERAVADESYTICSFTDGSECEAWTFFRGDCAPGEYQEFAQAKILYEDHVLGFSMRLPVLWLEQEPEYSLIPVGDTSCQGITFFKDKESLFSVCELVNSEDVPDGFEYVPASSDRTFAFTYRTSVLEDKQRIDEVISTFAAE